MPSEAELNEPRYTTPLEEARIRKIVRYVVDDAELAAGSDAYIVDRYTMMLRTVFNSMLRDRMQRAAPRYQLKGAGYDDAEIRSHVVVARQPDAPDCPQGAAMQDSGARAAE